MPTYARPVHPGLRRLRALKMLELLLQGKSQTDVARAFNTTKWSVRRALDDLDKEGLLSQTEDKILQELYPLALEVYKKHLKEQLEKKSSVAVEGARDILKIPFKRAGALKKDESGDMTLEEWVIRRKLRRPSEEVVDALNDGPPVRDGYLLNEAEEVGGREGESGDDDQREDD